MFVRAVFAAVGWAVLVAVTVVPAEAAPRLEQHRRRGLLADQGRFRDGLLRLDQSRHRIHELLTR